MNEKEAAVKRCEIELREKESDVRCAKIELDRGYEKLKADLEIEYAKLKKEYESKLCSLEQAKVGLESAKETMAKGFEE